SEIVSSNCEALKVNNIKTFKGDSLGILKSLNETFDWIYIDPARRNDSKQKVFLLKDCTPNVPENLKDYFKYSNNILIKTASILDISAGLNELEFVKKIYIISLENEVKELLWILEKNFKQYVEIEAVNISKKRVYKNFKGNLYDDTLSELSFPKSFLYEAFTSVLKTGN